MELRQLHYLTVIARERSLSDAAKRLFVSQPTLSRAIGELERELGVPLFDRVGRKLVLNDNGAFFAKRAQLLLNELDDACNSVAQGIAERQRIINCVTSVPLGFMAAQIRRFTLAHPDITIKMGYPESTLLAEESIDIQIFDSPRELVGQDGVVELAHEEFVVVLPPSHRLEGEPAVRLADLENEPFIMGNPSTMRTAVEGMFFEAGFKPRIVSECYMASDILAMVQGGNGCCIAAPITWFTEETMDCYTIKRLTDVHHARLLYARLANEGSASEAAREFAAFLAKEGKNSYSHILERLG